MPFTFNNLLDLLRKILDYPLPLGTVRTFVLIPVLVVLTIISFVRLTKNIVAAPFAKDQFTREVTNANVLRFGVHSFMCGMLLVTVWFY